MSFISLFNQKDYNTYQENSYESCLHNTSDLPLACPFSAVATILRNIFQ